ILPDFTSAEMNKQSDGELFWKITTGKPPMPTFGQILSDEQRWLVVRYLRTFCTEEASSNEKGVPE
ncbi:MAG: cytochrome c, partial [bacterium]|nr:cytochrome c [bacterium]